MKKKGIKLFSLIISTMVFICNISFVKAEETSAYAYSDSATSNGVTLKVEWNEPVLGEPTTFHVSATGGSGIYKFNMEAPSYTNPDELAYESVADPSRGEWTKYTSECESQDYTFTMMATGIYNFRFHVMDTKAGVTYLRTNTYIQVSSSEYPSVNSIVQSAVAKCNSETNGSDYSKALWLHDWLLEQLDYDNSLKWSSAESALTRSSGTCQAYERAYAKLLSAAGIENAETRDTYDGHTWNAMKLDGKWYQVDCTWDDSSENYYNFNRTHLYFALSDELMAIAHQGHNNIYTVEGYATPSNSLENNYFVQNGDAQQWVESYRNRIQENLNNKNTEFSIQADNSTYPPSIYGIQNGIIAYVMNQNEWFANGKKVELVAKTNDKQFDFIVTYPVVCTNHDWDEGVITTEPTCTTKGVKTFTCKNCKTTKTEEVNALDHDYSKNWTIDKKATCTEEGSKSHHCTRCDSKKDVTIISKTSHNYDEGVITKEATKTETGIKTYTCKDCKTTKTEVIPKRNDDFNVDSQSPVIDKNSIKLNANTFTEGDTLKVYAKITDNVGIASAVVILKNNDTNKSIQIRKPIYHENNGLYEFSMKIDDQIPNGHWYLEGVQAYDAADNLGIFVFDSDEYSFIVKDSKVDSESPVIDLTSIKLNTNTFTEGDTLKVYAKITDNVGIASTVVILKNNDTNKSIQIRKPIYHENNGLYEFSMKIDDQIPNGHWYLEGVQAYDSIDNLGIIVFDQYEKPFIVTRNNMDVHNWDDGVITTKATCTTDGVKTYTCKDCKTTKTEVIKALGHDYSKDWTIDRKATCNESGSKSHHCARCDSKTDVTVIPKTSHNWNDGVITTSPTCTKDGVKTYTCKDCKTAKTEVIKAFGHDYSSSWTIDKKATCTESGSKSHHCTRCDEKTGVTVIPKTSHNFDIGVITTAPTCAKDGVKTYTCKDCKTTKTEVIKALGHDYSKDWTIDKKATCTESGSKSHHCARCDSKTDVTVIPKTSHNYDNGVITTAPTCAKDGVKIYTCKDCKVTKTEVVKALGHDYSKDWTIDKKATCTESGSKSHHCTRCHSKEDVTAISKLSHDFDNGVITTAPTCTKDGVKTYTCKDCKTTKTEVIKALGHDYSKDWTIDKKATCTESGSKSHHCIRCDSKSDVTVIPKTSHNFDNGVITTAPTCTKDGIKTYTCKDCKTTKTEVVKALGHDYSKDWTIDKKATCLEEGSKSHHCTRCDSKVNETVIPKLSHDWILTSTVNPTRDHEGKKVYTCNLCKETKEESIPKLVGKWVSNSVGKWYEYSDGTYENSGFKKIENETYYFTSNGYVKTGWLSVNNNWYFFKNSGCMVTSNWVGSYYMDSEGKMKTNAFTPDGYYCGADGVYVRNAWVKHNGNYYYMDANGLMKKNAWAGSYYLGADGVMKTNTFTPDGYYVGSDGVYYRNRWIKYENKYYYTNSVGLIVKNAWIGAYYLGSDGVMMINSFTPDGYYVGADGAYLRNQKIQVDGKEYYLNAAGKVARNQWVGDYYLNGAGSIVKNHWAGNYWCGADGRYVKSSWVDDGRYYVGSNGVYVTNQWIGDYYLNGAGLVTKNAWVGNYWCGSDGKYVRSSWVDNNQYYVGANGVYVPGRWVAYASRWCYYAGSVYAKDITLNIGGKAYTFDSNGYMK